MITYEGGVNGLFRCEAFNLFKWLRQVKSSCSILTNKLFAEVLLLDYTILC